MSHAAALSMLACGLATYVALVSQRLSLAPGWRDQRWFGVIAVTAAIYSALDIPATTSQNDTIACMSSRVQFLLAFAHLAAWVQYTWEFLRRRLDAKVRMVQVLLIAMGASGLIPDVVYLKILRSHAFAPLKIVYREPLVTLYGELALTLLVGSFVVLAAIFASAWRRGVRGAALHCGALAFVFAMAVNDALVVEGVLSMPYLIDVGFLAPVAAVAYGMTARFVEDARDLANLRLRLEALVEDRSRDLGQAQAALFRSEKLAALGQLAAGVAHEINNPIAVVVSNMKYLADGLSGGAGLEEALECVRESEIASKRIAHITRQLLDAGRLAGVPASMTTVAVKPAVAEALRLAEMRAGGHVKFKTDVPDDLQVMAQESMLVQVLVNLFVNGAQAVPGSRSGLVTVQARSEGARVLIAISDNGDGMSEEVMSRVFEPFFTTKPIGQGSGLGLAVSRGLIESLGGDLRLESKVGAGTRATVELKRAVVVTAGTGADAPSHDAASVPKRNWRLLVVDDELPMRASLQRVLGLRFEVEVAASVDEALERLDATRFDAILADLIMPKGGGEQLVRELQARRPQLVERVVFMTGGATTEASRRFLASVSQPVLEKPLDLSALDRAVACVVAR